MVISVIDVLDLGFFFNEPFGSLTKNPKDVKDLKDPKDKISTKLEISISVSCCESCGVRVF